MSTSLTRQPHHGPVPRTYSWQVRCRHCRQLEVVTGVADSEARRNARALGWRSFSSGLGAFWLCGTCARFDSAQMVERACDCDQATACPNGRVGSDLRCRIMVKARAHVAR